MSACDQLVEYASAGAAPALRAVDCLANQATGAAFGRLFGTDGALLPALTILLTLYIAFFAVSLLTGRSRIGISALTPRMMTLGLVLTFATSWVAYQGVVWNLAVGAPDEVAGVLMGARGSATTLFADRIDIVFAAIEQAGETAAQPAPAAAEGVAQQVQQQGSFTPANLMWLAALLLLLGTVGVLVTARIALAVLLALGPVFVVMALFGGTRGLTAGWLRGVAMTAVTPLFVVTGGGLMLELLVPVVRDLGAAGGVDGRAALALFVIAAVHVALMGLVLKVSATIVAGWSVFGLARAGERDGTAARGLAVAPATAAVPVVPADAPHRAPLAARRAAAIAPAGSLAPVEASPSASSIRRDRRSVVVHAPAAAPLPVMGDRRAHGIGSRYRASPSREMLR